MSNLTYDESTKGLHLTNENGVYSGTFGKDIARKVTIAGNDFTMVDWKKVPEQMINDNINVNPSDVKITVLSADDLSYFTKNKK